MNGLLLFSTIADFDAWHEQVNIALNYPNTKAETEQYTEAFPHPNIEDDRVVCFIDENCPSDLLNGQIQKTLAWAKEESWFPEPEE